MSEHGGESDPIVIDEVITIDGPEVKRAEFATVVFHNIAETYPEDAHVECKYTVTSDLVPSRSDYVALYKVGWMSPTDYIYYEWAPLPKNYQAGVDADSSVLFPAHKLPKDDGEFYQFCYVSSSRQIRGASTPFQFRRPGADDFVEVEDDETNMLVIRSKTIYLEENLQKSESQRKKMVETQEALQKERDNIITKYQETKNRLVTMESENLKLKGQVSQGQGQLEQLRSEIKVMITLREELEVKIKDLTQTITEHTSTTARQKAELTALQGALRNLQTERDELSGKNANLQEQADLFKKQYSSKELAFEQYSKQAEDLQIKLTQQESLVEHLRLTVAKLNTELDDNKQNLDRQTAVNLLDKERIEELEERLKNAEDKLSAAEQSKDILMQEMVVFTETQQQMSLQLERSKTECDSMKQKLCRLEEDFSRKTQVQKEELEYATQDLATTVKEKEALQGECETLREQLTSHQERNDTSHGSMSIMKQSLTQIKQRLEKKEKQYRTLENLMRNREQEFLEHERESRREIEDLKEKIFMCSEEYKTLYIEKSKLQRKLHKHSTKRKSHSKAQKDPMVESATVEKSETASEVSEVNPKVLEQQLDELSAELEQKLTKKEQYKAKYLLEKEAREEVEKAKLAREQEVARLKTRIDEIPAEWDLKVRALEKCVTEKEMMIEELNNKLRHANQARNDETGASMSPRTATPYGGAGCGPEAAPNAGMAPYVPYVVYPQQHHPPMQYPYPPQNPTLAVAGPPHMIYPNMNGNQGFSQGPIKYPEYNSGTSNANASSGHMSPVITQQYMPESPLTPHRAPGDNSSAGASNRASVEDLELLEGSKDERAQLQEVLQPLPAPLEPVRLPSAKVAATKLVFRNNSADQLFEDVTDGFQEFEPKLTVKRPAEQNTEPRDQDRFYDAEGAGMKLCPVCSKSFPADVDDTAFMEHQIEHVTVILCPICKMCKPDNMSDDDFSRHVNKHCDEDNHDDLV